VPVQGTCAKRGGEWSGGSRPRPRPWSLASAPGQHQRRTSYPCHLPSPPLRQPAAIRLPPREGPLRCRMSFPVEVEMSLGSPRGNFRRRVLRQPAGAAAGGGRLPGPGLAAGEADWRFCRGHCVSCSWRPVESCSCVSSGGLRAGSAWPSLHPLRGAWPSFLPGLTGRDGGWWHRR